MPFLQPPPLPLPENMDPNLIKFIVETYNDLFDLSTGGIEETGMDKRLISGVQKFYDKKTRVTVSKSGLVQIARITENGRDVVYHGNIQDVIGNDLNKTIPLSSGKRSKIETINFGIDDVVSNLPNNPSITQSDIDKLKDSFTKDWKNFFKNSPTVDFNTFTREDPPTVNISEQIRQAAEYWRKKASDFKKENRNPFTNEVIDKDDLKKSIKFEPEERFNLRDSDIRYNRFGLRSNPYETRRPEQVEWRQTKGLGHQSDIEIHSQIKDVLDLKSDEIHDEELPNLDQENVALLQNGGNNMSDNGNINDANEQDVLSDGSNQTGQAFDLWHEPIVKYDPNYVPEPRKRVSEILTHPVYAQDTVGSLYNLTGRKRWDPYAPIVTGPSARVSNTMFENDIHLGWFKVLDINLHNDKYVKELLVPVLKRRLNADNLVSDRNALANLGWMSNADFNDYINFRYEQAIKLDEAPDIKPKTLLKPIVRFFNDRNRVHIEAIEVLAGAAVLASNVMFSASKNDIQLLANYKQLANDFILSKNDANLRAKVINHTVVRGYIDYEHFVYPKHMADNISGIHTKVQNSPTDLLHQIIEFNMSIIMKMIKSALPDSRVSLYITNPMEWAIDYIRYAKERIKYAATANDLDEIFRRDLNLDPIYMPLPMRIAVEITPRAFFELDYRKIPAEVLDAHTNPGSTVRNYLNDELWNGKAFLTSVRNLPWRNEIAPQLWDSLFFGSTDSPKIDANGSPIVTYKDDVYSQEHTNQVQLQFERMSDIHRAGKILVDGNSTVIMRKNPGETHDNVGWYYGFFNISPMNDFDPKYYT